MYQSDTRAPEMSDLSKNCVRLTPKLVKPGIFSGQFSVYFHFFLFIAASAPDKGTPLSKERDRAKFEKRKVSEQGSLEPTAVTSPG